MKFEDDVIYVPKFALDRLWPEHDYALGLYVALLNYITTIVQHQAGVIGLLLQGDPMTQQEWASLLQVSRRTLQRQLTLLQEHGLIAVVRLPYAVRIIVFDCAPKGKKARLEDYPWLEEIKSEGELLKRLEENLCHTTEVTEATTTK